jgi:hypothetical protein
MLGELVKPKRFPSTVTVSCLLDGLDSRDRPEMRQVRWFRKTLNFTDLNEGNILECAPTESKFKYICSHCANQLTWAPHFHRLDLRVH